MISRTISTGQFYCGFNPVALRTGKALWSFGCTECNRVKTYDFMEKYGNFSLNYPCYPFLSGALVKVTVSEYCKLENICGNSIFCETPKLQFMSRLSNAKFCENLGEISKSPKFYENTIKCEVL